MPLRLRDRPNLPQNPDSPTATPQVSQRTLAVQQYVPPAPQIVGSSFTGATLADSALPPDTMGAVGPTQFVVAINKLIRTFDKSTGTADGTLNVSMNTFFSSVMTPIGGAIIGNFTTDPRVRYDRLSGRWIVTIIDVPYVSTSPFTTAPNRVLIAVSSGSTITNASSFTFFFFQHDTVAPAGDTGNFADYPTLGIDNNALYIGDNVFGPSETDPRTGASGFVVRKSSILGAGPIVVTAFRGLVPTVSADGPYSPQGVDNFDAAATQGYFIGVSNAFYGRLIVRRVSNPGGAPTVSANIAISVSTTQNPIKVPHLGNSGGTNGQLDASDDRLFAAQIRNDRLWTAHNIQVNSSGVASTTGGRDGSRWYELQNLGGTPSVVQSGTVFDPAATSPKFFWIPSIAVSGQGHVAMGFSTAGAANRINAGTVGRLFGDPSGTMQTPVDYTSSATAYNPPADAGGTSGRRWGDYSLTSLDPNDDMTMWTIQEFCDATDSYGLRVVKLAAPPPATPSSCSPSNVPISQSGVNVVVTGVPVSGSGFFDPGANLASPALPFNHIAASVSGGVVVNSVTYTSPTSVTLNLTTTGATAGAKNVTITNPDGQSVTGTGILTVNPPPTLTVNVVALSVVENAGAAATTVVISRNTDTASALTVNLSSSDTTEATLPLTATILAGQTSVTVNLAAVDDLVADGTQTVTITASAAGLASGSDTVDVTDNETPILSLNVVALSVAENAGAAATTVVITRNTETAAAQIVNLSSSDTTEATVPLTATILAGQTSVTVDLAAVDDAIADGTQTVTITASAAGFTSGSDTLNVTDNDPLPTVQFTSASQNGAESVGTMTITAQLSAVSGLLTTVPFTVSGSATNTVDFTISSSPISIPAGATTGTVTITVIEDNVNEPNETVVVALGTPNNATLGAITSHTATITPTDPQSLIVSSNSLVVNEGATSTFTVRLGGPPTGNVTVTTAQTSGDPHLTVISGASLGFSPASWNIPQNITIAAAEDDDGLNGQALFQVSASNYPSASVTATEADNDIGVTAVLAGVVSGNYDFSGRDVTIHDVTLDPFDGRAAPADHALESPGVSGDGNSSGSLRISANSIVIDGTVEASAKGYGGGGGGGGAATSYYGVGPGGGGSTGVGLETSGTGGFRGGGGSGNGGAGGKGGGFGGVAGSGGGAGGAGGSPNVSFAGGGGGAGGGLFGGAGGGSRGGYASAGTNGDSSTGFELFRGSGGGGGSGGNAGTSLNNFYAGTGGHGGASGGGGAAGGGYAGGGGGGGGGAGGGMITLVATGQIQIAANGKLLADGGGFASLNAGFGAGGGIGLNAPSVIISPGAVVRNLGGFEDGIGNTVNGGTVKLLAGTVAGSLNPNLAGRVLFPGISVEQPAGNILSDGVGAVDFEAELIGFGIQRTFTIRSTGASSLTGLAISVDGASAGDFAVSSLASTTLAPGGSTTFNVTFSPASSGLRNAVLHLTHDAANGNPFDVSLTGTGQVPSPGVTIAESGGSTAVTEGGATDTYTVRLNAQPTQSVTINLNSGSQVTVSPLSLTFTTLNWHTPQMITVTAFNDNVSEGPHTGTINHTAASADASYNGIAIASVSVAITDNDIQSLVVSPSALTVNEGGTNSFAVNLAAQPLGNVSVTTIRSSGDADLGIITGSSLTFTAADWSTPKMVTLGAAEDADGANGQAVFTVSSAGLAIQTVTATEADNDTLPEIAVERPAGTNLLDGIGIVDFGTALVGGNADLTFTVRNTGTANLTGLGIAITGANAGDFSVAANPTAPVIPGGSTTFTVRFTPGAVGARSAALQIASNDADENPFDIAFAGSGTLSTLVRPGNFPVGLQAWWKLDEAAGSRADSSGKGNHLTDNNTVGSVADDYWGTGERSADFEKDNSAYLSITNAAQTGLGITSSYSFAVWIKPESLNTTGYLISKGGAFGNGYAVSAAGPFRAYVDASEYATTSPLLEDAGKWQHLAVVFDDPNNVVSIYHNGNLVQTFTSTVSPTNVTDALNIGRNSNGLQPFDGLMKDAAIWNRALTPIEVKSLALGTDLQTLTYRPGNVSTQPTAWWKLNEVGGTRHSSILGPHPITVAGSAQVDTGQSKFGGGGLQLNGSTDYLRTPMADGFNFGASDFTIEFWIRFAASTGSQYAVMVDRGSNTFKYIICGRAAEQWYFALKDSNVIQVNIQEPDALSANVWYHVAFVRNGSSWKVYRDGQLRGSGANYAPACPTFTNEVDMGAADANLFVNGWMDELRISKGVARYTANFTPPAAPFVTDANTSLLLHFDGPDGSTNITDAANSNSLDLTDINAVGASGGFMEGAGASFSGDYLVIEDNQETNLTFDSQEAPLTVSVWVKPASLSLSTIGVVAKVLNNADPNGYEIALHANGSAEFFVGRGGSFGSAQSSANAVPVGTWSHLLGVHDPVANQVRLYVDGKLVATTPHAAGIGNTIGSRFTVGVNSGAVSGADYYSGGASDLAVWNYVLTAAEIKALATGLPLQRSGIVSYWSLDETSGTRMDGLGANHLTSNNGVGSAVGVVGKAADFEKDNSQYLSIADAVQTGLDITQDITVMAWVKPESTSALTFLDKNGNNEGYNLNTLVGSAYSMDIYGSSVVSTTLATVGAWQHVVGVRDEATKSLWINSSREDSNSQTAGMKNTTTDFFLGRHYSIGSRNWDGLLDEVVVAQRWFRDEEIKTVYNKGLNGLALYAPEIVVEQPAGTNLTTGTGTVDFGARLVGANIDVTFTVRNIGAANLTGLGISMGGATPGDFTVIASPAALVAAGGTTVFTVRFTPGATGVRGAVLHLASNDADEAPFAIALTGTGQTRLEAWRQQYFGTPANTGNAANIADPNGNGIVNFLEYALGGDPIGGTTGVGILPQPGISATNRLQITLTRYLDRNDITLTAQAADSPGGPWSNLARSLNGNPFTLLDAGATITETGTGNTRTVTVIDLYPVNDPAHPVRYLRLQVMQ